MSTNPRALQGPQVNTAHHNHNTCPQTTNTLLYLSAALFHNVCWHPLHAGCWCARPRIELADVTVTKAVVRHQLHGVTPVLLRFTCFAWFCRHGTHGRCVGQKLLMESEEGGFVLQHTGPCVRILFPAHSSQPCPPQTNNMHTSKTTDDGTTQ